MIEKFKATIYYTIDKNHPDYKYYKNPNGINKFSDIYKIDTNCFFSQDSIIEYIKRDLALVAGGGRGNTDHIHDVTYKICGRFLTNDEMEVL